MNEVSIEDLELYEKWMTPKDDSSQSRENRRKFALELLQRLPVIEETEPSDGVVIQTRLLGLSRNGEDRISADRNQLFNSLRGLLTDLLSDETHAPSDSINKENDEIIIRHRKDLI